MPEQTDAEYLRQAAVGMAQKFGGLQAHRLRAIAARLEQGAAPPVEPLRAACEAVVEQVELQGADDCPLCAIPYPAHAPLCAVLLATEALEKEPI